MREQLNALIRRYKLVRPAIEPVQAAATSTNELS
jgi:hypothetical protein